MKIQKGDTVKVLIGKDKGREGVVVSAFPKKDSLVVKGLNIYKKHVKPSQGQKGGIVEKERALHSSKLMLICPSCKKATRVSYQIDKTGSKYRICQKCKAILTNKLTK
ncbi:MAG: 50S ribosomal protein L24 [Microgenomates group bacterium]